MQNSPRLYVLSIGVVHTINCKSPGLLMYIFRTLTGPELFHLHNGLHNFLHIFVFSFLTPPSGILTPPYIILTPLRRFDVCTFALVNKNWTREIEKLE